MDLVTGASLTAPAGLAVLVLLGARHGLDPDHIAAIDGLAFAVGEARPRAARWVGALFALGHSLSVGAVAVGASLLAHALTPPDWLGGALGWVSVALLALTGGLNLHALQRRGDFAPVGWRARLLPRRWLARFGAASALGVGVMFGLVFDTASQAAAWGLAASASDGVSGALLVSAAFAAGMIAVDTADGWLLTRMLQGAAGARRVTRYRLGVGWLIVALSFGMAALGVAELLAAQDAPEWLLAALGAGAALGVLAMGAAHARRAARPPLAP